MSANVTRPSQFMSPEQGAGAAQPQRAQYAETLPPAVVKSHSAISAPSTTWYGVP